MDMASFLNYKNSYVRSLTRLLGHDPDESLSGETAGSFDAITYERIIGKEFREVWH